MSISVFDMFSVGIGPSSSHTVGPMRAALPFADTLRKSGFLLSTIRVKVDLYGSLAATGYGHGIDKAIILGLCGETPEHVDISTIESRLTSLQFRKCLALLGSHEIQFQAQEDIVTHAEEFLPVHPNGMRFLASDAEGNCLQCRTYYSVGGGFVISDSVDHGGIKLDDTASHTHSRPEASSSSTVAKRANQ